MAYTIYTSYTAYWNEVGHIPSQVEKPEVYRIVKQALLAGMPEADIFAFDVDTAKGRAELREVIKELQDGTMEALDNLPKGVLHYNKTDENWTTEAPIKYNPNKGVNIMLVVDKYTNEVISNDNSSLVADNRPLVAKVKTAPATATTNSTPAMTPAIDIASAPASVQTALKTILDDKSSAIENHLSEKAIKVYEQVKEYGQIIQLPILTIEGGKYIVHKNQHVIDAIAYFSTQRPEFYLTNPLMAWVKTSNETRLVPVAIQEIQRLALKSSDETVSRTSQRKAEAEEPQPKPEAKPAAKPEAKPAAKPEAKPAAKPEAKPAAKPVDEVVEPVSDDLLDKLEAAYHTNLLRLRPLVNVAHLALGKPQLDIKVNKVAVQTAAEAVLSLFGRSLPTIAEKVATAKAAAPKSTSTTLPAAEIRKIAKEKGIDISKFNMKSSKDRAAATALVTA